MGNSGISGAVVIICTHNPNVSKLNQVFESILNNSSNKFRLITVDNASDNSIEIKKLCSGRSIYIFEPKRGNAFARARAIKEVGSTELLIFVDDDNYVSEDYVENALKAAQNNPHWGCFGGISFPSKNLRFARWKKDLLPYVGIVNKGSEVVECHSSLNWVPYEPIGAGMCIRPEVCRDFLNRIESETSPYYHLGRVGKSLLSGEDSFIARQATIHGFYYGYDPKLKLIHDIRQDRVRTKYLMRLLYYYGKSDVILDRALEVRPQFEYPKTFLEAMARFLFFSKKGMVGLVEGFRQIGQYSQFINNP
jgi:glycosyltransferase involved in cell wall biosynthesis